MGPRGGSPGRSVYSVRYHGLIFMVGLGVGLGWRWVGRRMVGGCVGLLCMYNFDYDFAGWVEGWVGSGWIELALRWVVALGGVRLGGWVGWSNVHDIDVGFQGWVGGWVGGLGG